MNVPVGSLNAYYAASQWQDFVHINEIATGIQSTEIPNLKLFPNPVKDVINITAENLINKVEIYTLDGKIVMQENNFTGKMNVSSLVKGIYMVRVYTLQGIETIKMIKN